MDRISGSKRRHQGLRTGFPLTKVNYGRVLSRWMEMSLISFFQNLAHLFLVIGHQGFGDGLCERAQIWVS